MSFCHRRRVRDLCRNLRREETTSSNDKLLCLSFSFFYRREERDRNRKNLTSVSNLASKRENISSSIEKLNEEASSIDDVDDDDE